MKTLLQAVEFAETQARSFFERDGYVNPLFHITTSFGHELIMPAMSSDKRVAYQLIRMVAKEVEATRVLYMCEAWTIEGDLSDEEIKHAMTIGVRNMPNARECIQIQAEDESGELITADIPIVRVAGAFKAVLGPMRIVDDIKSSSGMAAGLLPPKGRPN